MYNTRESLSMSISHGLMSTFNIQLFVEDDGQVKCECCDNRFPELEAIEAKNQYSETIFYCQSCNHLLDL